MDATESASQEEIREKVNLTFRNLVLNRTLIIYFFYLGLRNYANSTYENLYPAFCKKRGWVLGVVIKTARRSCKKLLSGLTIYVSILFISGGAPKPIVIVHIRGLIIQIQIEQPRIGTVIPIRPT